jgi:hypothetical protein
MVRNSASTTPSQRYRYIYTILCSKKRLQMHVSANDVITEGGENKAGRVSGQLTSGYIPGGAKATASVATSH